MTAHHDSRDSNSRFARIAGTACATLLSSALARIAPATMAIKTAVYDDEGHVPFGFVYDGLR